MENKFDLENNAVRLPYTKEIASLCNQFSCEDKDLDEFFSSDVFLYDQELLGRTYAWIDEANPSKILGLITLANDSVKSKHIPNSAETD